MYGYDPDEFLGALNTFFEEDVKLAEDAGYTFEVVPNRNKTRFFISIKSSDELLPKITVDPVLVSKNAWEFEVTVDFPELELADEPETMTELLDSWKDSAKLADDINSVRFDVDEWITG